MLEDRFGLLQQLSLNYDKPVQLPKIGQQLGSLAITALSGLFSDELSGLFGNSLLGQILGQLFSTSVNSASNTISSNILKGLALTTGLSLDVGSSVAGTGMGIAGNLLGKLINDWGGDTWGSRFVGQGIGSTVGSIGGGALSNIIQGKSAFNIGNTIKGIKSAKTALDTAKKTGEGIQSAQKALNVAKLGAWSSIGGTAGSIVGSALGAANGPSKEYGGKYGNITQGMDTAYNALETAIGFVPGWGLLAAGAMALNKGLSNLFGSTDGMTTQDAILGSAFMPFFVKWLNSGFSKDTSAFNNLSWQNTEKTNSFMQNAFGNLNEKFDRAREEASKTWGLFSRNEMNNAQANIDFANDAFLKILGMTNQNEWQKIRANDMTTINNQRYSLSINGGFSPIQRGKQGMKILNNQTNHNIGMRLLSGAALIDNKQMILSAKGGIKVKKKDDHTYEMEPMLEITVIAPRKYIAGYDKNGNPIYTTDRTKSISYEGVSPSESKYQKWANRDKNAPKYIDPIIKAALISIGTPLAVTTAPATLGTLFKASTPLMEVLARPTTTTTKAASRLFPNLSRALPYTEMADRGLMGYIGARGIYDAGKGWYNGTTPWYQAVPQMGLSGLMMTEAAPLVKGAAKNLPLFARHIWNGGNVIQRNIPYNPYNFYRGVGRTAIDDANKSGILRGGAYDSPYFGLGRPAWHEGYVIEGTQNSANWLRAKGPRGEYNVGDFIGANEYARPGYTGLEALPWNGTTTLVPTTGFTYWLKHPIIGWRNHSFKSRGSIGPTITPENAAKSGSFSLGEWHYEPELYTPADNEFTNIVSPNLTRLNNLAEDRKKFMLEHPIHSYTHTNDVTDFNTELRRGMRTLANDPKYGNRVLDGHVSYEALGNNSGLLGYTEGSFYRPDWIYNPYKQDIKLWHKKGDRSMLARIVDSHEAKHYTGNDAENYIYEYLVQNKIIDDSKISSYHKNADRGEIGTHLGELADYLGFMKPTKTSLWQTPSGKTSITSDDVEEYKLFLSKHKMLKGSIFDNILDMDKFIKFYNEFKFGFIPLTIGTTATLHNKSK